MAVSVYIPTNSVGMFPFLLQHLLVVDGFFLLFLIGWWLYTAVLVSAVPQRDSAVSIHIFSAS